MTTFRFRRGGFTLVELLVVVAIVGLLIAILLPSLAAGRRAARETRCLATLRELATCTHLYAAESADVLPRSLHSAGFGFANGLPWGYAFTTYLASEPWTTAMRPQTWRDIYTAHYRCPFDDRDLTGGTPWSYGYNVYYELTATETGDRTWRQLSDAPHASATVLFGEIGDEDDLLMGPAAPDHVMAHFWSQFAAPPEVVADRHAPRSGYAFLDGHADVLALSDTFDVGLGLDRWNPATAN